MRGLFKIWLVILIGAGIGALVAQDSGYVLLSAGLYTIEMSLALLVLLAGLLFVALYFLIRLIVRTYRLPSDVRTWKQRRGARLAQNAMTIGYSKRMSGTSRFDMNAAYAPAEYAFGGNVLGITSENLSQDFELEASWTWDF